MSNSIDWRSFGDSVTFERLRRSREKISAFPRNFLFEISSGLVFLPLGEPDVSAVATKRSGPVESASKCRKLRQSRIAKTAFLDFERRQVTGRVFVRDRCFPRCLSLERACGFAETVGNNYCDKTAKPSTAFSHRVRRREFRFKCFFFRLLFIFELKFIYAVIIPLSVDPYAGSVHKVRRRFLFTVLV